MVRYIEIRWSAPGGAACEGLLEELALAQLPCQAIDLREDDRRHSGPP
jgi:hypothetical protein